MRELVNRGHIVTFVRYHAQPGSGSPARRLARTASGGHAEVARHPGKAVSDATSGAGDFAINFHFAGETQVTIDFGFGHWTVDTWFSGDYRSIWDADVLSTCSIAVSNTSDHIDNFSYNADDVPGEIEQMFEDEGETRSRMPSGTR